MPNIVEAAKQMRQLRRAGNAVMLEGPSGRGKTSICFEEAAVFVAECAAQGLTCGVGQIFLATQTPPDLIGYQFKGERTYQVVDHEGKPLMVDDKPVQKTITVTDPSVPLWMMSMPFGNDPGGKPSFLYDRFYLIIDEYGQGEPDVKRGAAEIFLKGGTAPWYLPQGSVRVACTNKGARYGVTKDFDFCIARRTLLKITDDIDVVIKYLNKPYVYNGRKWQTMPVTKAWAESNPTIVFEEEPKEQGPWCMPRTVCDVDRYMQVAAEDNGGNVPHDDPHFQETLAGIIGTPAAMSLGNHLKYRLQLPTYKEVVSDPEGTPLPQRPDLAMMMAYELAGWADPKDIGPVIKYITRMPRDLAVTFISSLLRRDYTNFIDTQPMRAWVQKNAALLSIIQAMTAT